MINMRTITCTSSSSESHALPLKWEYIALSIVGSSYSAGCSAWHELS
jgi:hypothetical protein